MPPSPCVGMVVHIPLTQVSVSLQAGTNSVAIANTAGTGPNLDRIKI